MNWYVMVLRRFSEFSGRSRRREYWMFLLMNIIISFALGFIDGLRGSDVFFGLGVLGTLYVLAILVPGIAVAVRRLHDTGRSGLWLLVGLIPILGALMVLWWMTRDGDPETNQYGPNPKLTEGGA